VVNAAGALTGGGAPPAAAGLFGLLQRPEMRQAMQALLRGGGAVVPVGRSATPVPANAFAGLLARLAREAEAEAWGSDDAESVPAYLVGPSGQLVADPADPDQRAARLLQLLIRETADEADFGPDYAEAEYDDVEIVSYEPARW
jgi:hypothetical protein